MKPDDINQTTNDFYESFSMSVALCVPVKIYRTASYPKRFTLELRNLIKEKKLNIINLLVIH